MSNPREILLRWKPEANSVRCRLSLPRATLRAQHVPRPELPRPFPPPEIPSPAADEDGPIPLYLVFPIADYHVPNSLISRYLIMLLMLKVLIVNFVLLFYTRKFGLVTTGLNGQDGVDNEVTSQVGVRSGVTGQFGNSTAEDGQLGNGNGEAGQNSIGIAAANVAAVIGIAAVNAAAAVGSSDASALVGVAAANAAAAIGVAAANAAAAIGVAAANAASSIGVAAAAAATNSSGSSSGTVTFFPSWLLASMIGISILLSVSRETYVQLGRSLLWRIVWSYLPSFSPWSTPSPPSTSQLFLALAVGFHSFVAQTAVLLVSMLPSGLSSMGMMSFLLKFLLSFGITSIPAIIVHKVFLRLFSR